MMYTVLVRATTWCWVGSAFPISTDWWRTPTVMCLFTPSVMPLLGACAWATSASTFPILTRGFAGADSRVLLREVMNKVQAACYRLGNADLTIIAQAPKMAPHLPAMREHLATDMQQSIAAVNIKATTTEQLGFTGRGEGIACHAVVLLLPATA